MKRATAILAGLGTAAVGGAVMYFTDPKRGRERRAMVCEKMGGVWEDAAGKVSTKSRDIAGRARGMAASATSTVRRGVTKAADEKLAKHVRSRIRRVVSHPDAIEITAQEGQVTLSGAVLADEAGALLKEASGIRGVKEVENRLRVYRAPGQVPELQGEEHKPGSSRAFRTIVSLTGGALTAYGLRRRRDSLGRAARVVGVGLLSRGVAGGTLRSIIRKAAA